MMADSGTATMRMDFFNKTRMRQPDRNSNIYELSISRAPQLRCVKSTVKSCMTCEACRLVVVLNQVKEWFIRCGDPAKRRFILGLIHRVDSLDLFSNISFLLQPLQNKDFTYTRSRSRPSLQSDAASPPTNHALNLDSLDKAIEETWQWFSDSAYWSKLNFLLGIMQHCDSQLLFIMANSAKTMSKRERLKQRAVDEGILEEDENEYMSLCSEKTQSEISEADQSEIKSILSSTTSLSPTKVSTEGDLKSEDTSCRGSLAVRRSPASATQSVPCFTSPSLCSRKSRTIHSAPAHAQHTAIQSRSSFLAAESNLFSEDYISGDEDDFKDEQILRIDPSACVLSSPSYLYSGTARYKDFIRCLPVHLSKYILKLLDKNSLTNCLCITKHWRILAEEVQSDYMVHQLMTEEIMLMQGASAKGMNPRYAKLMPVHVPLLNDQERDMSLKAKYGKGRNLKECYNGVPTRKVILEERNVYCGAYNVLVLQDWEDHHRCTNFSGGRYVTSGSYDRKVRLIDAATGKCERAIQGHAGSIRCLLLSEERDIVLSGSYDTSVRCWDIKRGNCKCIFRGHRATVMCISLHGNNMASGSRDKSVKVWNFETGKCRRTFRHRHVVLDVKVSKDVVISGCEGGKVKVWDIESATLVKSLDGHHGAITCLKFDAYHIITGSMDGYAMAWSAVGQHKKCLQAFRHPKEVLCLEFLYCRIITGSADGKLRIWNLLNGDCLRLIRGNSRNDPINAICATENRIVINTLSNLLIFNFEAVEWDYNLPPERPEGLGTLNLYKKHGPQKLPHPYVRAQRLHRADTKDSLPARPPSRTAFFLDHGPGKRITSAPPRVAKRDSTLNSINHHVTRIMSARKKEVVRPQSSPAKVTTKKTMDGCDVSPFTEVDDIRERIHFTKVMQTYPKPPPLPDNRSSNVISRGRSAPVYRTKTLPEDKRGWTTSAEESITPVVNKIMVTPSQAKLKLKQRPKSAHVDSKVSVSKNPLQSLSCLNLKTYSNQLVFEEELKKTSALPNRHGDEKKRAVSAVQLRRRPQSCI